MATPFLLGWIPAPADACDCHCGGQLIGVLIGWVDAVHGPASVQRGAVCAECEDVVMERG
jgi:hypothetical protein